VVYIHTLTQEPSLVFFADNSTTTALDFYASSSNSFFVFSNVILLFCVAIQFNGKVKGSKIQDSTREGAIRVIYQIRKHMHTHRHIYGQVFAIYWNVYTKSLCLLKPQKIELIQSNIAFIRFLTPFNPNFFDFQGFLIWKSFSFFCSLNNWITYKNKI